MNRFFIMSSFCLYSLVSLAMEMEPSSTQAPLLEIALEKSEEYLLQMCKNKEFAHQPIQELTLDFLPYFLEESLNTPFIPQWTSVEHLAQFIRGIKELQQCRKICFSNAAPQGKRLNRMKEKATEKANGYFTEAAKPFQKLCYIRRPHNNESEWQPRTMYLIPALYAHAYTAVALTEYNLAHASLIKAIKFDHNYLVGGMSIELLMVLAFTFKYEPSQKYIREHNLIQKLNKEYVPVKEKIIAQTNTVGLAASNILNKIACLAEAREKEKDKKVLEKLSEQLAPKGFSLLTTVRSPEYTTFVLGESSESLKPLTGKERRKIKRKSRELEKSVSKK